MRSNILCNRNKIEWIAVNSIIRWDGIGLSGKQQLDCIEQLVLKECSENNFLIIDIVRFEVIVL